jgi:hypothetical protein
MFKTSVGGRHKTDHVLPVRLGSSPGRVARRMEFESDKANSTGNSNLPAADSPVGEIHLDYLKAQCSRCLRLPVIMRQKARKSQPFHRDEVKTIKRSTVEFAYAPLLPQRDMNELPRQFGPFEGVDFRKGAQSAPISAQLCPRIFSSGASPG